MTKKLFKCEATIEIFILAEDEPDEYDVADAVAEEVRNNGVSDIYTFEVKDINRVPSDWRDGIPYGNEDDKTVSEILSGK